MTPSNIAIVNSTSRCYGAVGAKALVPRYVEEIAKPCDRILDYGAGKNAAHTVALRAKGLRVTAHEIGANFDFGLHTLFALSDHYDIVFASNVLNVQNSVLDLLGTLKEIWGATWVGGTVVFNYPASPRKMPTIKADAMERVIYLMFGQWPERVGGTKQAPVWRVDKV